MNTKSSKFDLPYFFRKRLRDQISLGKILELRTPASERASTISTIEDILRWADDGGQNIGFGPVNRDGEPGYSAGTDRKMMDVRGERKSGAGMLMQTTTANFIVLKRSRSFR